uniref:DNA replication licensing factor MCM2 n=1 Tax=Pyramimonas obovata TaxID=1411642 RepID=A0A7S0RHF6_9CHLO|mmetsp:Transcript_34230/g.74865  ORF Transcript_34230/g.74865 Transcript_34230/m.74865 type:complete len:894 (+) Transcript_34230:154-2835(+)|eukprot:CAMPEP_0118928262 /NCGR_PEP_ID=MMETSP1169-20130426/5547_1 /TAXON_ID=36882 /ORGANISM="Pyramimonas obovata, Strain CCMP722" /LENGTH=893 /DNA_ID=CAMNT_0006870187 /DNA_START=153 /DNA_END=2834 /DNA_ORIENTATION=-
MDDRITSDGLSAGNHSSEMDVQDALSEDNNVLEEVNDEEEDGEDLLENMQGDYEARPHLDRYESEGLGEEIDDDDDPDARLRAERALNQRDRREQSLRGTGQGRRLPGIFGADGDDEEDERPRRRRRTEASDRAATGSMDYEEGEEEDASVDLESFRGTISQLMQMPSFVAAVKGRFKAFLNTYTLKGKLHYVDKIEEMCSANRQSLEVSYLHLSEAEAVLAIWVADAPSSILPLFSEVAKKITLQHFESYEQIHENIFVRITGLPITDLIRDIRQSHLGVLIRIAGVVTRRTGVFPQLQQVKYDCLKCGYILGPYTQTSETEIKVSSCPNCQSKGPFTVNVEQTLYRNYQKITLQESPGTVPAGRLPRHKDIIVTDDLIDIARPGEEIDVTGIFTNNFDAALNMKNGFPVFATVVEANYITKKADLFAAYKLSDEDKVEIQQLAADPRIGQRIIKSIAPSIHGHSNIKTALALSMFGGEEKHVKNKHHRLRGDINVLLLGDPGVAKSQFLKYVEKTATRAVYTTGKGASAVGLTAAVHKDPITREWTLEGGALVLADKGVCLIDEFDKMNDQDRVSIHEAMEQQSISISKAGIVTTLQARCAVIAAANPVGGRYDSSRTFAENVELTEPILSRFDVLCVVKDVVDPVMDERLARFVVGSHAQSHPDKTQAEKEISTEQDPDVLSQDTLRKYVTYAKMYCQPKLQHADVDKISQVYADLRREFVAGQGVPIAVRHVESLIRMSEANARMHLREYVNDEDVNLAIQTCLHSFIATQKYSVQRTMQRKFKHYLSFQQDFNSLALDLLRSLVRETMRYEEVMGREVSLEAGVRLKTRNFVEKCREYDIADLSAFYGSNLFAGNGFTFADNANIIVYTRAPEADTESAGLQTEESMA